jgi:hypothetical protein
LLNAIFLLVSDRLQRYHHLSHPASDWQVHFQQGASVVIDIRNPAKREGFWSFGSHDLPFGQRQYDVQSLQLVRRSLSS